MTTTYEVQGAYAGEWETIEVFGEYYEAMQELKAYRQNEYGDGAVQFRVVTVEG